MGLKGIIKKNLSKFYYPPSPAHTLHIVNKQENTTYIRPYLH